MTPQQQNRAALESALAAKRVAYTRAGDRLYRGLIMVYGHDNTSPTEVVLLCVVEDTPEIAALLRGPLTPLSPTEPR